MFFFKFFHSFSEEDVDAMDALDIKPPQARIVQQSSKSKRREGHERSHHKRSERHRSERHFHREKHHRDKQSRSTKDREHEKERYYRDSQNYEQSSYMEVQYVERTYRERKEERNRYTESSRKHEEKKYKTYTRDEKQKDSGRYEEKRGDKELHDLRQRLLNKRTIKSDEEYFSECSSSKERRYRLAMLKGEDNEDYDKNEDMIRERRYIKKHEQVDVALEGEAGAFVREIIDISTGDERRKIKEDDSKLTKEEKAERELRREKLLEAEREMARLKEQRERRHLERATKRKHDDENYHHKRTKTDENNVVTVSDDNSESELEEEEYKEKQSEESDTSSQHTNSHEEDEEEENSDKESERSKSATPENQQSASNSPEKEEKIDEPIENKPESDKEMEDEHVENKLDENLPPYYPAIQGCRSVAEFQSLNRIEEGTYGVVYRARDKRTDEIVALKRLKMEKEKEGFPITSLREINTLLKGQHPNIVTVREIVVGSNMDKIYIVMDYVEHDLKSLMETMRHKKQNFMPGEIKCLLKQLLLAVAHLHDNWILHRDLKTSNLLLSHKGILKVGDFGLAREYGSPLKCYTPIVVTLWYRAPELLLCTKEYSTPIDMWSVGCIFGELLLMNALFPGKSEVDQLNRIFKDLGTPSEKIWTGFNQLPAVKKMKFTDYPVSNLRSKFNTLSEIGLGLLIKFLTYDPSKRVSAEEALKHSYFNEPPLPIDPAMFPTWPAKSELGQKRALAASPKPPSAGGEFKKLGDDADDGYGFRIGMGVDHRRSGPGFNLKF